MEEVAKHQRSMTTQSVERMESGNALVLLYLSVCRNAEMRVVWESKVLDFFVAVVIIVWSLTLAYYWLALTIN